MRDCEQAREAQTTTRTPLLQEQKKNGGPPLTNTTAVTGERSRRPLVGARIGHNAPMQGQCVRDRLWLWGHQEGSHNGAAWGLPGESTITPELACEYMGVPNLIMVVYGGDPAPPFEPFAKRYDHLDRVVWSIVGDAGSARNDTTTDIEEVLGIADRHPNVVGAIMDDLFFDPKPDGSFARFGADDLARIRSRLHSAPRQLDLWIVVYRQNLDQLILPHLANTDIATFWTWRAEEVTTLADSFARFEAFAPKVRKVLGCYMWDYGTNTPMPAEHMQHQCELGLRWLRTGSIEGIVFLATCICDLGLEAVEWTRQWIARVGDETLSA